MHTPTTFTNELHASAFVSSESIFVEVSSGPTIELPHQKPVGTPNPHTQESTTVLAIPSREIGEWRLKTTLLVQLVPSSSHEWLAMTWLEGVPEYGTGEGDVEAIEDLVASIGEYRESLERREDKLGESAKRELGYVKRLVERCV